MPTKAEVMARRRKVAAYLAKSVTSTADISKAENLPYATVDNDIRWLRKQTQPWLMGLAGDGYAFDVKTAIEKLEGIERELEVMRQKAEEAKEDPRIRLDILGELRDTTIARIQIEGEGPTLLGLRRLQKQEEQKARTDGT